MILNQWRDDKEILIFWLVAIIHLRLFTYSISLTYLMYYYNSIHYLCLIGQGWISDFSLYFVIIWNLIYFNLGLHVIVKGLLDVAEKYVENAWIFQYTLVWKKKAQSNLLEESKAALALIGGFFNFRMNEMGLFRNVLIWGCAEVK